MFSHAFATFCRFIYVISMFKVEFPVFRNKNKFIERGKDSFSLGIVGRAKIFSNVSNQLMNFIAIPVLTFD